MTYPVELPGGFSGLSAGQIQGIAKAPFTGHFNNVPMLGDRRPKTLIAATGAWYFDNAPHGDFSGTDQSGGTGGPAQMRLGPTGSNGAVTIGRVRTASGNRSTTTASTRNTESSLGAGDTDTISSTVFNGCSIGDVVTVSADSTPNSLAAGTYYVIEKFSDTKVRVSSTLGGSSVNITDNGSNMSLTVASPKSFQGEQSITYDHDQYTYKLRVLSTHKAPITASSWDWDYSSRTLSDPGAGGDLSGYTFTGWDMVYVTSGTGAQKGWYRIASKPDDDTLVLTDDSGILSATDITDTSISIEVYPCNFATYITGATWTEATKRLTKSSAFSSYTFGSDDVVLIKAGTGTMPTDVGVESWVKVASKDASGNFITLVEVDPDIADAEPIAVAEDGATDIDFILFQRPAYVEYDIDTSSVSSRTAICSSTSLSPAVQIGDLYYMYVATVDGEDAFEGGPLSDFIPYASPGNDPENAPTATALTTPFCAWPFNTFSSQMRLSVQGNQGLCTYPEARDKTQMNAAWWGLFTMPKETMIYGDRLCIDFNGGYDYNGTPFIFEIMLIPNFDPEADWSREYAIDSEIRMSNKAVWFQTDPLYHASTASRDIAFHLECQTGGFSRGAGNSAQYVQNWTLTLDIASGNAIDNPYTAPTQQKRYFTRTSVIGDHNYHTKDTRWTVLVKTEHPSMKGKPGYHGYYFAEPFSVTTGNGGGVWLHHTGTVSAAASGTTVKLPLAPRTRFTNFNVTYFPNGSY